MGNSTRDANRNHNLQELGEQRYMYPSLGGHSVTDEVPPAQRS